jgi:hypothetical protein
VTRRNPSETIASYAISVKQSSSTRPSDLILIQYETPYFPVHHTIADTPDKIEPRDYASAVAVFAATIYEIAERPQRFGRRLTADEIKRMADETKVGDQWRAAGVWK